MLDDLETEHGIESGALGDQVFDAACTVGDHEVLHLGMPARRLDVFHCGVDAGHLCAEPGERLGDEPTAAADIEYCAAFQAFQSLRRQTEVLCHMLKDEGQPCWADLVQGTELAVGVPPL